MPTLTFQPGDRVVSLLGTPGLVVGHKTGREGQQLVQIQLADGRVCDYLPWLLEPDPKDKP